MFYEEERSNGPMSGTTWILKMALFSFYLGSFEEDTALPEGLKNWNKEQEPKKTGTEEG